MKHRYVEKVTKDRHILHSLHRIAILRCLKFANLVGSSAFISWLVRADCKPMKGEWSACGPRLWMLGKEGLTEDLMASLDESAWAVPVEFSRGIPKAIAKHYLPRGIDDNNYSVQEIEIEKAKDQYMQVWQEIFKRLPRHSRPRAIATANFGYYAERELARAAEREHIPFIVMHKECLKSKGRLEFFKTVYQRRGRFEGRKILVYNERERDLQVAAQVASPGQVLVCGMSRLDRLHRWRVRENKNRESEKTTLLALGFTPKTGLPRIPRKGPDGGQAVFEYIDSNHEELGWDNFFYNYNETLVKIARDNPDWEVQLKLKSRLRDAEPSIQLMEELKAPDNLKVIVGGDPLELIKNTDVVCGFNTTAILEGLAAGLPVVTPEFDEVIDLKMCDYAVSFGKATYRPDNSTSMYKTLTELLSHRTERTKTLSHNVKDELYKWVGNPDGRAGHRVRQAFEREMVKN